MARVSIKAVLVGNAADMAATLMLALPIYAWLGFRAGMTSYTGPEAEALADPQVIGATWFSLLLFIGCGCSVLAGYIAARIAQHTPLLHGALAASFCFFAGAYALFTGYDAIPPFLQLLIMPLGPALGALGGAAWVRWPLHRERVIIRRSSRVRRAVFAIVYSGLTISAAGVASAILLSVDCLEQSICSPTDTFISIMLAWLVVAGLGLVIWASSTGHAPGARHVRTTLPREEASTPEPMAV